MAAPVPGADNSERRRRPRKNVIDSQLITVGLPCEGTAERRGILLDVSESGMAVQPFVPLTPGTSSGIEIELEGSEPAVKGTGLIAWVGAGGRAGIRFVDMPPEARERLNHFLDAGLQQEAAAWPAEDPIEAKPSPEQDELDLDGALEMIAERARDIAAATGVAVALADEDGIRCRFSSGDAPDVGVRLQPHNGLSAYCVRTGELVHCIDTLHDSRIDPEIARQLNVRSLVIVPVFASGKVAGLLEVLSASPNAFESRQIERLRRVADLLGGTIEEGQVDDLDSDEEADAEILPPLPLDLPDPEPVPVVSEPQRSISDQAGQVTSEPVSAADVAAPVLASSDLPLPEPQPEPVSSECESQVVHCESADFLLSHSSKLTTRDSRAPAAQAEDESCSEQIAPEPAPAVTTENASPVNASVLSAPEPAVSAEEFKFAAVSAPEKPRIQETKKQRTSKSKKKSLPIHRIGPVFLAATSGPGGEVVLGATITKHGTVDNIRMISGPKSLGEAASEAVSQWRCKPYELNGAPTAIETTITIHFTPAK
jgi:protein TonB